MRIVATVPLLLALVAADAAHAARLKSFSSCKELVGYAREGALRTQGGVGVAGRALPAPVLNIAPPQVAPVPPPMAVEGVPAAGDVSARVPAFSGTNTQELDVDEPDVVKTDGRRIVVVTDKTLRVIRPGGPVTGTLPLDGFDHRLLLRGDRVLVIAGKGTSAQTIDPRPVAPEIAPPRSITVVTEIDISGAPKVLRTMDVPGRFVDARQNGATARLVIDNAPAPIIAGASLKRAVKRAGVNRFLGHTTLKSNLSGKTFRRKLAPCDAVTHPARFSGLGVLAILTIDLDRGMYSLDRDGVMAGAQVVYGSAGSLYVASRRYVRAVETGGQAPDGLRTEIHRFDISDPARTVYRATGSVPGFILNNYALSEHDGDLRVASTEEAPWVQAGTSRVTVLRQDGRRLVQVGAVGGLGDAGERIFGVRFMGARAFVVTFRQVDPLYAIDLSDPTAPKVAGSLKLPGYSAYLHPVGEDRLLGIGRDGAAVKTSLFDISDMAAPREVAQLQFPYGMTTVESEPHAFLYWAPSRLAVLPLTQQSFSGAVGVRVAPDALSEAGRVQHQDGAAIVRSLVIGDQLYTLSWLGLAAGSLDNLATSSFTAF